MGNVGTLKVARKPMRILVIVGAALTVICALPIFSTSARRDTITDNSATLRSIALALEAYAEANGGKLPQELTDCDLLRLERLRHRTRSGEFHDWIYLPAAGRSPQPAPLVIAPAREEKGKVPRRLVLLSDYKVTQLEESSLPKELLTPEGKRRRGSQ